MVIEAVKTLQFSEKRCVSSHIPMILREDNDQMILEGHVSRANELWKHAAKENPAMVIFQGDHAYIHPGWYETKKTTGKVLPTWNYQVIHLHGFAEK